MNLQELIHYFKHLGPHDHIDIGQEEVNVILGTSKIIMRKLVNAIRV